MKRDGNLFPKLIENREDSDELKECIIETVSKLMQHSTEYQKPGILLGKIQSGKTRAFIGSIALAFDNDYDMAIVLTKGTKALAEQTYQRLKDDFEEFIENDEVRIYDIMDFPPNLTKWELNKKNVIIVKKEINNLNRLITALEETYPDLKQKKLLIIDDEADFASVSYRKNRTSGEVEPGKISSRIDDLRTKVAVTDFLQVTATPYSLYLQPESDSVTDDPRFLPKRPTFTILAPIHETYVGGDYYFNESVDENSPAYHVFVETPLSEIEILKKEDRRRFKIENVLTSGAVSVIRKAIMNFIVGSCIRQTQQSASGLREEKYGFVVHTDRKKATHEWQERVVRMMKEKLVDEANKLHSSILDNLIQEAFRSLQASIKLSGISIPSFKEVADKVKLALRDDHLMITKVNSDNEVKQLLDDKGQLRLRTPLNIYIGGQILDRGITIRNLIGFYYGRNPRRFQQDTVLQHSRMFGARPKEDLAVTRFYTTRHIHNVMRKINDFDEALRNAFEKGAHDKGVYFIRKDALNRLVPCSPNKLLLSKVTTLRPYKRLLPIGFQTDYKTKIQKKIKALDSTIEVIKSTYDEVDEGAYLIDFGVAVDLLEKATSTLEFSEGYEWDKEGAIASLEHLSKLANSPQNEDKVWLVIREGKNMSRTKKDTSFSDDPDGGTGETARTVARRLATDIPALILIRQNGSETRGWRGQAFWWPVIQLPKKTPTSVFASEIAEE